MNRIMCGKRDCFVHCGGISNLTPRTIPTKMNANSERTFSERALVVGLALGKDGLDEDAHVALWRVPAAYDAEPEALLARTLLERDRVQAVLVCGGRPGRPRAAAGEAPLRPAPARDAGDARLGRLHFLVISVRLCARRREP